MRRHDEPLPGPRIAAGSQALAKQLVHSPLKSVAGALDFLLNELGNIVVDG